MTELFFLMTDNDRSLMTRCLLAICVFSLTLERLFSQDSGKQNQNAGKLLHPTTLFCTFAPAIQRKLLLYRMSVLIDDSSWS